jgi:hypothetical protein
MKSLLRLLPALALAAAVVSPVRADEVTDNLDTAKTAYEAGNYSEAITSIDYANQLIRQKKGDEIKKLLPSAPKGWEADEAESEAAATSMLGGGVTAKRSYRRDNSSVTIKIQSDSPMLQATAMMLSNPMFMSGSGAKMESIKSQKVSVKFSGDSGEVKAVVDGRYLVEIEGSNLTREDLMVFAKALDYTKLAAMK